MILVDSSAWIDYLRASGSVTHLRLRQAISDGEELAITEPIVMEVLAGARDDVHLQRLRRLLDRAQLLPLQGLADFEDAADLCRMCRRGGSTIRSLTDCLIAVVAIRHEAMLLHGDRDFAAIAGHVPLRLAQYS